VAREERSRYGDRSTCGGRGETKQEVWVCEDTKGLWGVVQWANEIEEEEKGLKSVWPRKWDRETKSQRVVFVF